MKSWKKLRELTRFRERSNSVEPTQDIEEITKGMQDVQDMLLQYDGLHAVSSRVAARAYGFAEAVQEMAAFLSKSFAAADNGELGQVFKAVSRVQFELSRLLHLYSFHVSDTITLPTEGLLNELQHIEDTRRQYDEKRHLYDVMRVRKQKHKSGKNEAHVDQQLQEAKEIFDEVAMFLGCRLHSVEQGRPRNLLTQATRHHAAQMHLFSQSVACLEGIESYISQIVQERNITQSLNFMDDNSTDLIEFNKNDNIYDSPRSSTSEQGVSSPTMKAREEEEEPRKLSSGSRSAPISPIRYLQTQGVNSIHEVTSSTSFTRSNSWIRNKGRSSSSTANQITPSAAAAAAAAAAYSVTEPASSSPARSFPLPRQQQQQKKRFASSGPLTSTGKPSLSTSTAASVLPTVVAPYSTRSGPLNQVSPTISPPSASPPRLHRLPPPPLICKASSPTTASTAAATAHPRHHHSSSNSNVNTNSSGSYSLIPHSAPLTARAARPLPPPPLHHLLKPLRKNDERVSPLPTPDRVSLIQ